MAVGTAIQVSARTGSSRPGRPVAGQDPQTRAANRMAPAPSAAGSERSKYCFSSTSPTVWLPSWAIHRTWNSWDWVNMRNGVTAVAAPVAAAAQRRISRGVLPASATATACAGTISRRNTLSSVADASSRA